MERTTLSCTLPGLALLLACPGRAQDNATLQKQLANPVSGPATLPFDYTGSARAAPGANWQHLLAIAPSYPVRLNRRWNLVNRATLPVQSNPGPPGQPRKVGTGDFTYEGFFTPSERTRQGWIRGVGLTWSVLSRPPDFMPVNTIVGAGYNVVRPDRACTWFLRFQVNFILPK